MGICTAMSPCKKSSKLPFLYFAFPSCKSRIIQMYRYRSTVSGTHPAERPIPTLPARGALRKKWRRRSTGELRKIRMQPAPRCTSYIAVGVSAFVTDLLDERSGREFRTQPTYACRRFIVFIYMFPGCIVCARVIVGKRTPAVNRGNARNHLERYHSLTIESNVIKLSGRVWVAESFMLY